LRAITRDYDGRRYGGATRTVETKVAGPRCSASSAACRAVIDTPTVLALIVAAESRLRKRQKLLQRLNLTAIPSPTYSKRSRLRAACRAIAPPRL